MKNYFKILRYITNYKGEAIANIVFNILAVLFATVSFAFLIPFFDLLFQQDLVNAIEPEAFTYSATSAKDWFNYHFSSLVLEHGKPTALMYLCIAISIIYFFKNLFRYLSTFIMAPVRMGVIRDLRQEVFEKIMGLPMSYFTEERKGDVMTRLSNDVNEIEWGILNTLEVTVREPLTIIASLAFMLIISPQLTLFVIVLLLITGILIGGIGKTLKKASMDAQNKLGELISTLEESLSGVRIIKAFSAEIFQSEKFKTINNQFKNFMTSMLRRRDMSSPMSEFLGITTVMIVLYYGGLLVLDKNPDYPTGSEFIAFLAIFSQLINPSKAFSSAFYNIQKALASAERIEAILGADDVIINIENPIQMNDFEQGISFENVVFQYEESKTVLNNISFNIPKGQTVALVGESGAGKSTIADLVPRFYDLTSGNIKIDDKKLQDIDLKSLRKMIGVVSQEAILFNDSVLNNITFNAENISRKDVIAAARIANAHEFIEQLENGYDTNIGDRGQKLSGGQRQRITIARAVLKNPAILILDEATSALDTQSEKLVQEALENLMKDRTSIVIAHRLSTIQNANNIIVLDKGKITEQGTHNELISKKGMYYKLIKMQNFG